MADLYSVISGIEPTQQDVIEAELVARQIISAKFPDLDLREGTGLRDLLLRPAAHLLALCKKGFDSYFQDNTLPGVTDESSQELVDNILGNFFLTRNTGTLAVISARLYFARQKSVTIPSGTSFSTDGEIMFYPASTISVPDGSLLFDAFQNEYYLDIDLVAADKGEAYNLSEGSLLYFSNFDPYFLHAEINYLITKSLPAETNSQFIARAETAISTRNLINLPSIDARIKQDLNYVTRLVTIGAGDPFLHRDKALIKGKQGGIRLSTAAVFTDGNSRVQLTIPDHGLIVGQLVNLYESITGLVQVKGVPVYQVIDSDTVKITLGITITPHTPNNFYMTPVDNDIYVHLGGCMDIYCGDELVQTEVQYTTDSVGKLRISGPVYAITRASKDTDTIPVGTAYTTTFHGSRMRADFTLSQDPVSKILTCTMKSHPLTLGRYVKVVGWPTDASTNYWVVTNVIDGDKVVLGDNLPLYSVNSGLEPELYYTDPANDFGLSDRQMLTVDFGVANANKKASFTLKMVDKVQSVQDYLESDSNRVVCADPLARAFDFYSVNLTLVSYADTVPTSGQIRSVIEAYFASLVPGDTLLVSNIVAKLAEAGFDSFKLPIGVTAKFYSKDWFSHPTLTVTDAVIPPTNTCIFILGTINISQGVLE